MVEHIVKIDYIAEIARVEAALKGYGIPVAGMLRRADVAPSQWQRWKSSVCLPNRTSWRRVTDAFNAISAEHPSADAG